MARFSTESNSQTRSPIESWALVSPTDVVRVIRRRLPSVFFTTVFVTGAVVALLIAWPNQYRSEGLMYVRLGRASMGNDPTAKASTSISLQESRTAEVISIGEMVGSREIAERAVERVGVGEINRPRNWMSRSTFRLQQFLQSDHPMVAWLPKGTKAIGDLSSEQVATQLERERAVKNVLDSIHIEIAKNGYTVAVEAQEDDPLLVQSIVQAVMDEYGRYHVEAHRNAGSESFFEQQSELARKTAIMARENLQRTRNEMGWLSAESAETSLRERLIDLEANLHDAESRLAEATSQAEELRSQLASTEPWVPTKVTSGIANLAADTMRSQLYDVQIQEGEELAQVSPEHPRYRRLKQKMSEGEELASEEESDRSERTEAINPVYQELETQFQTVRAKAVGLKSRRDSLREMVANTKQDFVRLNEDLTTLSRLTWEANLAEEIYHDHSRSLEEARVNAELDAIQMSDVSVIQPASLNLKKSGPARALLSVIGLLFGLSVGLLQAILRDGPTLVVSKPNVHPERDGHETERKQRHTLRRRETTGNELAFDELVLRERREVQTNPAIPSVPVSARTSATVTVPPKTPGDDINPHEGSPLPR